MIARWLIVVLLAVGCTTEATPTTTHDCAEAQDIYSDAHDAIQDTEDTEDLGFWFVVYRAEVAERFPECFTVREVVEAVSALRFLEAQE